MKTVVSVFCALLLCCGSAAATTIDFDDLAVGQYTELVFDDLTLSIGGAMGSLTVTPAAPGAPISGNAIIRSGQGTYNPYYFQVDFNEGLIVNNFSIGVGDYNGDVDTTFLQAFDRFGHLLATDSYINPLATYGGDYLSVLTVEAIAYVRFWDEEPYPGAVYWDELSYTATAAPVPEPATFILLGAGLAGVGIHRRKRAGT